MYGLVLMHPVGLFEHIKIEEENILHPPKNNKMIKDRWRDGIVKNGSMYVDI
jgi:hypothetical protein